MQNESTGKITMKLTFHKEIYEVLTKL